MARFGQGLKRREAEIARGAGVSPLHPTGNPFEKGFLDFPKLSKRLFDTILCEKHCANPG